MPFRHVIRDLKTLFRLGARMLVITGGEPFLWIDGTYTVEDVVMTARNIGFYRIVICTNGTQRLNSGADYLWVSLDGLPDEHNRMRGAIYDRVVEKIAQSSHPGIYINFTVSTENIDELPVSASLILRLPNVRGILFHFFTPYLGAEKDLALDKHQRETAFETICVFR